MGVRRKGRELALQMLYQRDVTAQSFAAITSSLAEVRNPGVDAFAFARGLVEGAIRRQDDIDEHIAKQSKNWRIDRMATVDRNILRVAVYEFMETDTPKNVVINEALQLAKRYSSPDAVSFINGVLDAVCTSLQTRTENR